MCHNIEILGSNSVLSVPSPSTLVAEDKSSNTTNNPDHPEPIAIQVLLNEHDDNGDDFLDADTVPNSFEKYCPVTINYLKYR